MVLENQLNLAELIVPNLPYADNDEEMAADPKYETLILPIDPDAKFL
jgi:hypothetical protein